MDIGKCSEGFELKEEMNILKCIQYTFVCVCVCVCVYVK
jgi:hypothetical protein